MTQEIFGPILPILPFQSTEAAIEIVRRNPNPRALCVFSAPQTWART
jgi:aldehyde dehydrogenase (NAD+)